MLRPALVLLALFTVADRPGLPAGDHGRSPRRSSRSQANGSLARARRHAAVGSALIGQPLLGPALLLGPAVGHRAGSLQRAAPPPGSNLGTDQPGACTTQSKARIATLRAADPADAAPVPVDLVTASGSGLDPHVSPGRGAVPGGAGGARHAAFRRGAGPRPRRGARRGASRSGSSGAPRVNVLRLNLALDDLPRDVARATVTRMAQPMNGPPERPDPGRAPRARLQEEEAREARTRSRSSSASRRASARPTGCSRSRATSVAEGVDVVVGVVETHGRYETAALLLGLEVLPAATARPTAAAPSRSSTSTRRWRARPQILLLDELAHTNAPGLAPRQALAGRARAARRGHRRLHDRERPARREPERRGRADHARAGPRDGARLDPRAGRRDRARGHRARRSCCSGSAKGRSTCPSRRSAPREHFFQRGQPARAARAGAAPHGGARGRGRPRVPASEHGVEATWPTSERILVCVGPAPDSARLVRATRRMAAGLRVPWVAAYVAGGGQAAAQRRGPRAPRVAPAARRVARRGGGPRSPERASPRRSSSTRVATTSRGSCIGKPRHPRWRDLVFGLAAGRGGPRQRRDRGERHLGCA